MRVLFVCTGNTCRSPMMKFMFENYLAYIGAADMTVLSAGVMRHKKPISEYAAEVLDKHGVPYSEHISNFCDRQTVQSADVIICAEQEHVEFIKREYGEEPNVASLADICGKDLQDPYGKGIAAYESTYREILEAVPEIYAYITK